MFGFEPLHDQLANRSYLRPGKFGYAAKTKRNKCI